MKKLLIGLSLVSCALLGAAWSFVSRPTDREGQTVYRYVIHMPMRTPYDARPTLAWLTQNGFDVAGFNWQAGTIEVITDRLGMDRLKQRGFTGLATDEAVPGARISSPDSRYLNPQTVEDGLKELNAKFPTLTRLEKIGTSTEGRPIWALLISTTPVAGDPAALQKPSMIFDGMHHAREIMTPEIVMDVGQTLLTATVARSIRAMNIVSRWNVWIVPMLNVDGNAIVWKNDPWWRKNARGERSRVYGVDINRNYPFQWNTCSGSSGSTNAQDYRGPAAGSEPETQALARLGAMAQPAGSLSYHSYSELVLWPYGCQNEVTGDNALFEKIGREMAGLLPADSGRGTYTPGTPWQLLYAVDGDSMSFMHSEFGTTAFTFEVNQEFQPPYSLREPTLVKHRKAWQYFLDRMDNNLLKITVVDARTGQPTLASIDISQIVHRYGEKPFRTNAAGNYFKVLDPGKYSLRATLADGRQAIASVEMAGKSNSLQITVP